MNKNEKQIFLLKAFTWHLTHFKFTFIFLAKLNILFFYVVFYLGKSFRNILNLNIEIIESNWNSSGLLLDLLYMPGSELFCRIQGAIGKDDYNS